MNWAIIIESVTRVISGILNTTRRPKPAPWYAEALKGAANSAAGDIAKLFVKYFNQQPDTLTHRINLLHRMKELRKLFRDGLLTQAQYEETRRALIQAYIQAMQTSSTAEAGSGMNHF